MVKLESKSSTPKEKKLKKEKKEKRKRDEEKEEVIPDKKLKIEIGENEPIINGEKTPKSKKSKKTKSVNGPNEQVEEVEPKQSPKVKKSKKGTKESNETTQHDTILNEKAAEEKLGDFSNFRISQKTIDKLKARKVSYLFPVQAKSFDNVYDGTDVVAQARTGTGKTFSFAIPLVEKLQSKSKEKKYGRPPKVLVMTPTRELAKQVADDFESISEGLSILCVYGGTPYGPQEQAFRDGTDIVVGTPGRIFDFAEKGTLKLDKLKHMVLDEVDRMLDMGFSDMVDKILQFAYDSEKPDKNPQTLLWSATLPHWVHTTAKKYMKEDVVKLDLVGDAPVRTSMTVQHLAIKCGYQDRAETIGNILSVYSGNHGRAMVFCQTKRDADELTLSTAIKQETHVMHGDIPQDKREKVLKSFREGRYKCLITTDVAARGLDIPEVDLVVQCSPPKDTDSYIHRAGRTGRAGRQGTCVLFYKPREEYDLQWVEKKAGIKFKRIGAPTANDLIEAAANDVLRSLDGIPKETLTHFEQSAQRMIEEKGAVIALAAALAVISGNTEIKSRSLLNSYEGFTTYLFRTNINMNGKGYCYSSLARCLPQEVKDKVKGMRFCADKMGCVFDLPSEVDATIQDRWSDGKFDTLEVATELPELLEDEYGYSGSRQNGNSSFGGRGNGARGRGGFSSRGGNRGSGFGGRGSSFGGRGRGGARGRGFGGERGGFRGGRSNGFGGSQNKHTSFD